MAEVLQAFLLIFVAEMGDKTQILAMAFATKYPVKKVLLGIGIGAFLNHGLAVLLGSYLSSIIPINTLQMVAGFAFVGFALWTLKVEEEEDEEQAKIQFGPIATVSLAFFLGELGDKTQLTAITLAADAQHPAFILLGTVTGMIATGALGIFIGKKMGDKIPELGIKLFAALIFMFFGIQKLYQRFDMVIPFAILVCVIAFVMILKLLDQRKKGIQSAFLVQSGLLQEYYDHIEKDLENTCMGPNYCGKCKGKHCAIGYAKEVVALAKESEDLITFTDDMEKSDMSKPFERDRIIDSLVDTLWLIERVSDQKKLKAAHIIRKKLEKILLNATVEDYKTILDYYEAISPLNEELARNILGNFNIRKPIKDRIIPIASKGTNSYLIEILQGYLLIDTGYREHYEGFCKALYKENIELKDIKYIFITHVHDDHVGFLNQLLKKTDAKVILHKKAVSRLKSGVNSFEGGCSTRLAWLFCQLLNLYGKGKHRFEAVDSPERYAVISNENKAQLEEILTAQIVELPGHTPDSIGLLFDNELLFCGDAAMNGIPSKNHIIIWIENIMTYKASWKKMEDMNVKRIYPAHGKPFSKDKLKANHDKLNSIRQFHLTH